MSRRAMCTALTLAPWAVSGCARRARERESDTITLVFKHQPMGTRGVRFEQRLRRFEAMHPNVRVVRELLPNASDALHQYYLTALEGGGSEFDVIVADVIWVPEFARAGWIADLSDAFPADVVRSRFLPAAAATVIVEERTFALPWYLDVGLLYYRSDRVPAPPRTFDDLERMARDACARDNSMRGYVWQGRQSEGLVCAGLETVWGFGGSVMQGDRVRLDTLAAREGLGWMRAMIERGISPRSVLSSGEEESRRTFQDGRAVFMRNWPYAWDDAQAAGSTVRGRVGFTSVPTRDGTEGHGALGGWQLALNAHTPAWKRGAAIALIAELTSQDAGVDLALDFGRNPPQRAAYDDPRLIAGAPFIAGLRSILESARPRPVTPYYTLFADALQSEFSAIVAGVRTPSVALERAQTAIDHVMGRRA